MTVHTNGYIEATVAPGPGITDSTGAIRVAARWLNQLAYREEEERLPLECPECGVEVEGVLAGPDGTHVLRPCGGHFE